MCLCWQWKTFCQNRGSFCHVMCVLWCMSIIVVHLCLCTAFISSQDWYVDVYCIFYRAAAVRAISLCITFCCCPLGWPSQISIMCCHCQHKWIGDRCDLNVHWIRRIQIVLLEWQRWIFDAHCWHMGTAIKHPVPDRVKPSFVILDIRVLWRSGLSVRVPGCQKLPWWLNPVWHMMLYSYTRGNSGWSEG